MVKINSKELAEVLQLALAGIEAKQYELYELQFNTTARSVMVYNPTTGDKFSAEATHTKSTDFRIAMTEAKKVFEYVRTLDNIDVSLQLSSTEIMKSVTYEVTEMQTLEHEEEDEETGETKTVTIEEEVVVGHQVREEGTGKFAHHLNLSYVHHAKAPNRIYYSDVATKEQRSIEQQPVTVRLEKSFSVAVQIDELHTIPASEPFAPAFIITKELLDKLQVAKNFCSKDTMREQFLTPIIADGFIYATDCYTLCKLPFPIAGAYRIPLTMIDAKYIDCKVTYKEGKVILTKSDFTKVLKFEELGDVTKEIEEKDEEGNAVKKNIVINGNVNLANMINNVTPAHKDVLEIERNRLVLSCDIAATFLDTAPHVIVRAGVMEDSQQEIKQIQFEDIDTGDSGETYLSEDSSYLSSFGFGMSVNIMRRLLSVNTSDTVKLYHGKPTEIIATKSAGALYAFCPVRIDEDLVEWKGAVTAENVFERTNWRTVAEWKKANKKHFEAYHLDKAKAEFYEQLRNREDNIRKSIYNLDKVTESAVLSDKADKLQDQINIVVYRAQELGNYQYLETEYAAITSKDKTDYTANDKMFIRTQLPVLKSIRALHKERDSLQKQKDAIPAFQSFPPLETCKEHNETQQTELNKLERLKEEFTQSPLSFITVPTVAEYYGELPLVEEKKGKKVEAC